MRWTWWTSTVLTSQFNVLNLLHERRNGCTQIELSQVWSDLPAKAASQLVAELVLISANVEKMAAQIARK